MRSVSNVILVDTNVLVYGFDPRDHEKRARAVEVFERLVLANRAVLSVQCLSEFYNGVTRRLPERLDHDTALAAVNRFYRVCTVFDLTPAVVIEGCRGAGQLNLHLWDALIWAVAKLNQVPYVLTEDAPHGRSIEGVHYLNPFDPSFNMALVK